MQRIPYCRGCRNSSCSLCEWYGVGQATRGNPKGGGGARSESWYCVPAETRCRCARRRDSSVCLPRGKEANILRASVKVMFSMTLMFVIFFSSLNVLQDYEYAPCEPSQIRQNNLFEGLFSAV